MADYSCISIHAPRVGCDSVGAFRSSAGSISTLASREGCVLKRVGQWRILEISTLAPLWSASKFRRLNRQPFGVFNPLPYSAVIYLHDGFSEYRSSFQSPAVPGSHVPNWAETIRNIWFQSATIWGSHIPLRGQHSWSPVSTLCRFQAVIYTAFSSTRRNNYFNPLPFPAVMYLQPVNP